MAPGTTFLAFLQFPVNHRIADISVSGADKAANECEISPIMKLTVRNSEKTPLVSSFNSPDCPVEIPRAPKS